MLQTKKLLCKQNIPNYLTILRILCAILVVICLLVSFGKTIYFLPLDSRVSHTVVAFHVNDLVAGIFFVFASITDFLDGYIARKYHWVSDFGKLWDPLADKLLVDGVLICFAYLTLIPVWITVVLILRDFIVDAFKMNALRYHIVVAASWWGKWKTVCEMVGLTFLFFFFHYTFSLSKHLHMVLQYYFIQNLFLLLATLCSLIAMIKYIIFINQKIRQQKQLQQTQA